MPIETNFLSKMSTAAFSLVSEFLTKHPDVVNLLLGSLRGAKNAVVYSLQVRIPDIVLVALLSPRKGNRRFVRILIMPLEGVGCED